MKNLFIISSIENNPPPPTVLPPGFPIDSSIFSIFIFCLITTLVCFKLKSKKFNKI